MNQRITEYLILVVRPDIDPVSKEVCGGDHYHYATEKRKNTAFKTAKTLTAFYEVHVYEEDTDVRGHWIFKNGKMTHNMFGN